MSTKAVATIDKASGYLAAARTCLDAALWAYLMDGDSDGNEQALSQTRLMPRPLNGVAGGHTRLSLFGQTLAHPLVLAPVAYQGLFHPDGERATAMAATAQGGQHVISSLASQPFADIVHAARDGQHPAPWFQLYWQHGREQTRRLLDKAVNAGCSAVVLTVDAPVKRATLQLPEGVRAVNLASPLNLARPIQEGESPVFDGWMAQAPTWEDLAWLRGQTTLPLLIKGVLHEDDAARAVAIGFDGVVVSNHGGRVLAGPMLSLHALPGIVARVGRQVPVLFDSGIRSGRDAFVALAHGATAVLIGRPFVWGLAANGALGVAHVIRLLRDELELTMALTGCATLQDVAQGASLVSQPAVSGPSGKSA